MKKVFIGVGHGGKDPGAVANGFKESEVNLNMALAMQKELLRNGVSVGISRIIEEDDPLTEEIAQCNAFQPDLAVEVHNNAGGGDGFEVLRQTGKFNIQSLELAVAIEKQVKVIGQNSRGIKTRQTPQGDDYFGWLRQVNAPAVLCEGAFLDSKTDILSIDTLEKQQAFGIAYAKGVMDILSITPTPPSDATSSQLYTVQCFAGSKQGADNYAAKISQLKIDGVPVPAHVRICKN